ncbi:MAG: hypothetical protein LBG92_09415 [Prevotellaceae bacterium]|nr:hypothetical protein [Prevotellaceae bacterium]
MAKNLKVKKGQCVNFGNCQKANAKETIEVNIGDDFECPQCGGLLVTPTPPPPPWLIILLCIVGIAVLGAIYYFVAKEGIGGEKQTVTEENVEVFVNQTSPLPDNIASAIKGQQVEWLSDNPEIATISDSIYATSTGETTVTARTIENEQIVAICHVSAIKCPVEAPDTICVQQGTKTIIDLPPIDSGEIVTLVYKGGAGDIFKWYKNSCGGVYVGCGNNFNVTPTETTTYYGRWETSDGKVVSKCIQITVDVKKENGDDTGNTGQGQGQEIVHGTKEYSFGTYEGDIYKKYGIPEGNGIMTYTSDVQIAKHDSKEHYAKAGDRFKGNWGNGDIVSGTLYRKDGKEEKINVPKRPFPYDIGTDKNIQ